MIGTELLLGEIIDTNAQFLATELAECGIDLFYKTTVGDNIKRARKVLTQAVARSDLVIVSGGLGPTDDDLTRELVSLVTGKRLVFAKDVYQELESWLQLRYGEASIPGHNRKQAFFPEGSLVLPNRVGTAPGFFLEVCDKAIIALPGVPSELRAMFGESVRSELLKRSQGQVLVNRNLNFSGIGESSLEEILEDLLIHQVDPTLALYATEGKVRVRLTTKASSREAGMAVLEPFIREIRALTPEWLYGIDEDTLEGIIGGQLTSLGLTLALAESCTGGLVGHRITNVPGSSNYFQRGYIVYSNLAKEQDLGVPTAILKQHGAVSAQTAAAMAEGVRKKAKTDLGLAITGIAGPGGGSLEKPVGLVYISLAGLGDTITQRHLWRGDRELIKSRSAQAALHLLWSLMRQAEKTH